MGNMTTTAVDSGAIMRRTNDLQDKTREMETVRGLTWGSVFPSNAEVPPAGFEPALPAEGDDDDVPAVTGGGSLPSVLLAKVDALRVGGKA